MKKKTGVTIIGVFVALLLIAVVLCVALVRKYTPNKEYVAPGEVLAVADGEAHVVFWQEKYEKNALLLNASTISPRNKARQARVTPQAGQETLNHSKIGQPNLYTKNKRLTKSPYLRMYFKYFFIQILALKLFLNIP